MILDRASIATGYTKADIIGTSKPRPLCMVRWAIMDALRAKGLSLPSIGRILHRHHTTVLEGLRQADAYRSDERFAKVRSAIA